MNNRTSAGTLADIGTLAPKLQQIVEDVVFGDLWDREQLSKHDRSLITLASVMTQRVDDDELRAEIVRATAHGVTRDELAEVIVQVALYAGWPAGVHAGRRAMEIYQLEVAE